ncbi:hypothetical protein M407DRAFT_244212 [Tulasnella calospora MUT 4182]|uniref:Phosphotyrosine protein phosphatase I domain-containing protein n=1 Tax=Tulasnella calospora MUT 4182 TaxID=1051891 RepID=A0A0C3Q6N4_9AGAM|nr:hypothetical protein M407DRAFT_244212 [Tulasnella calospora MUT 4182]
MSGSQEPKPIRILVVCLGNICRSPSPMGEAVLQHEANRLKLPVTVDSAGTGDYHIGKIPDGRTMDTCKKHGVPVNHRARQLEEKDFNEFDYILASDNQNLSNIQRVAPRNPKAQVVLFGSFGDDKAIVDPYYGPPGDLSAFEECYKQCLAYSEGLLKSVYGDEIYNARSSEAEATTGQL